MRLHLNERIGSGQILRHSSGLRESAHWHFLVLIGFSLLTCQGQADSAHQNSSRTNPASSPSPEYDRRAADGSADCPTVTLTFLLKDHLPVDFDPYVQYDLMKAIASSTGLAEELFTFVSIEASGSNTRTVLQICAVSAEEAGNALTLVLDAVELAVPEAMRLLSGWPASALKLESYKLTGMAGEPIDFEPPPPPPPGLVCHPSCATCLDSTPTGCVLCPLTAYPYQDDNQSEVGTASCVGDWPIGSLLGLVIGVMALLCTLLVLTYVCFNGLDLAVTYSKRRNRVRGVKWTPRRAYDPAKDLASLPVPAALPPGKF